MKYMGSKGRYAKHILPIVLKSRTSTQWYVEPFCGGCNMIDKVTGNRKANDVNQYVIALFRKLQMGGNLPDQVGRIEYDDIRQYPDNYDNWLVGYVGICCSYSGKWFGGYAGLTKTKGGIRDYQKEARNNLYKQIGNLNNVIFSCQQYFEMSIPDNSIIYCDPPYEGTTGYNSNINHRYFWDWCRQQKINGHNIFISEYSAPDDFICVAEFKATSSLSANGKIGGNKNSIEKLFTI